MATEGSSRGRRAPKSPDAGPPREPSTAPPAPLDATDRAALAAWIFAVWRAVQTIIAIATNATRPVVPSLRIPDDIAGNVAADATATLDALFAQVRPLLREGGVPTDWVPGLSTPEHLVRSNVIMRARYEARQALLPPDKRRTWDQRSADDEKDQERALRRAGKDGP
jgi:hypothetical protein